MSSEICSRVDTKLRDQGQPLREQSKCAAFSLSRNSHQGSPEALDHTAKKFDRFSCPTPVSYSSPFSWNWTETGGWEVVTSGLAVWLLTSSFFRLPGALTAPVQPLRNGRPPDISSLTNCPGGRQQKMRGDYLGVPWFAISNRRTAGHFFGPGRSFLI